MNALFSTIISKFAASSRRHRIYSLFGSVKSLKGKVIYYCDLSILTTIFLLLGSIDWWFDCFLLFRYCKGTGGIPRYFLSKSYLTQLYIMCRLFYLTLEYLYTVQACHEMIRYIYYCDLSILTIIFLLLGSIDWCFDCFLFGFGCCLVD